MLLLSHPSKKHNFHAGCNDFMSIKMTKMRCVVQINDVSLHRATNVKYLVEHIFRNMDDGYLLS